MKTRRPVSRHAYAEDPATPDTCTTCGLHDPQRANQRHQLPDLGEQTAESRRRVGESRDE